MSVVLTTCLTLVRSSFTVSGNVPEEPVCTADGYVFEKRLVEKHLEVSVLRAWGSNRADGTHGVAVEALTCQY